MRAILYVYSEDPKKITAQLNGLRRLCVAKGWQFDEMFATTKDDEPKLRALLEKIRQKRYSILLVHSLDSFIGDSGKTLEVLNRVVHGFRCRFISLVEGIDSQDTVRWVLTMRLFDYFIRFTSTNLGARVENGAVVDAGKSNVPNVSGGIVDNVKVGNKKTRGRPPKDIDQDKLRDIKRTGGLSIRKAVEAYNKGLPRESWISKSRMAKALSLTQ